MINYGEPIFTSVCKEGKEDVIRSVYGPVQFDMEFIKLFWEKSRQFKTLFSHEIANDFNKFLSLFVQRDGDSVTSDSLIWVIDDFVGVFYIGNISSDAYGNLTDAIVYYTFFDRRHRGRVDLTAKMAQYLFDKYKFHRLTIEIPLYATESSFNFVQQLGFHPEGRRRKSAFYNEEWFDERLFGLLPENVGKPFNASNNPDAKCSECGKFLFPKPKVG